MMLFLSGAFGPSDAPAWAGCLLRTPRRQTKTPRDWISRGVEFDLLPQKAEHAACTAHQSTTMIHGAVTVSTDCVMRASTAAPEQLPHGQARAVKAHENGRGPTRELQIVFRPRRLDGNAAHATGLAGPGAHPRPLRTLQRERARADPLLRA